MDLRKEEPHDLQLQEQEMLALLKFSSLNFQERDSAPGPLPSLSAARPLSSVISKALRSNSICATFDLKNGSSDKGLSL